MHRYFYIWNMRSMLYKKRIAVKQFPPPFAIIVVRRSFSAPMPKSTVRSTETACVQIYSVSRPMRVISAGSTGIRCTTHK